jgi:hypothetical protein
MYDNLKWTLFVKITTESNLEHIKKIKCNIPPSPDKLKKDCF